LVNAADTVSIDWGSDEDPFPEAAPAAGAEGSDGKPSQGHAGGESDGDQSAGEASDALNGGSGGDLSDGEDGGGDGNGGDGNGDGGDLGGGATSPLVAARNGRKNPACVCSGDGPWQCPRCAKSINTRSNYR
jgi:hypothetical protein